MFKNQITHKPEKLLIKKVDMRDICANHTKVIPRREFDLA
jgi:hypothetical protein